MRPTLLLAAIAFFLLCAGAVEAVAQSSGRKSVHAYLAVGEDKKARTTFSSDVSRIYAFWKGEALEVGDKIQAVWIAEDVGDLLARRQPKRAAQLAPDPLGIDVERRREDGQDKGVLAGKQDTLGDLLAR